MASDLGLHCLPMSHKKDTRLIWAKNKCVSFKLSDVVFIILMNVKMPTSVGI